MESDVVRDILYSMSIRLRQTQQDCTFHLKIRYASSRQGHAAVLGRLEGFKHAVTIHRKW
jgi:hypothetical protein